MILTIHRGSHEIGGTCIELESRGGTRIVLDLGAPLPPPEETERKETDMTLPPVKGLYAEALQEAPVDALLISHAHQDHYGLMQSLRPDVPCFISEPTRRLVELTALYTGSGVSVNNYRTFTSGAAFVVGDFTITPYLVDHSAFDAHAFLIDDGEKRLFYSGDFRAHGRKQKLFDHFVAQPPPAVDVLLLEGTMLARPGEQCDSEQELEQKLVPVVAQEKGLVLAACSGQNIDRLVTLFRLAKRTGRTLLIDPYIAHILLTLSSYNLSLPHLSSSFGNNLAAFFPSRLTYRMRKHLQLGDMVKQFSAWQVRPQAILQRPDRYILLVRDSMVAELESTLKSAARESLLLYGQWKGYWERPGMENLKQWSEDAGMRFLYAHTSGHAMTKDLQQLAAALKPKFIVPVHTSCPEEYAGLFTTPVKVANDGETISICRTGK